MVGPRGTEFDPLSDPVDLFFGQPVVFLGGHFVVFVLPLDCGHDEALFRITGHENLFGGFPS